MTQQACNASLSRLSFNLGWTGLFGLRSGLLPLLLMLGFYISASSVWAANTLEQLDFVSANGSTRIYAHADAAVSHKTVELTPQRLVLDFDNVQPVDTIRTNFSSAPNIYSVALRRLDASHLRLTVQGSELTEPLVGFRPLEKDEQASVVKSQGVPKSSPVVAVKNNAAASAFAWTAPSAQAAKLPEATISKQNFLPTASLAAQAKPETGSAMAAPALQIDYANLKTILGDALPWLKANQNLILQLAFLGLLFTGLGLFILLKVKHLKPQPQGKPAAGWRHGLQQQESPLAFRQHAAPVGLTGLNAGLPRHQAAYAQAQFQAAAQQQGARPQQQGQGQGQGQRQGAVALNAALGQYARQQAPSLAAGLKAPVGSASMAKARLQNAPSRQQQPQQEPRFADAMGNNLPQKRPVTTNRQTPFTAKAQPDVANPEVLSFLRSVAEKMEQESSLQPANAANATAFRRSIRHLPS